MLALMNDHKISRSQAIKLGLSKYFTGLPCKHGHTSFRRTATSACLQCINDWSAAERKRIRQVRAAIDPAEAS